MREWLRERFYRGRALYALAILSLLFVALGLGVAFSAIMGATQCGG